MSSPEQHENADLKKYLWILIKSKCAKYINIVLYIINYRNITNLSRSARIIGDRGYIIKMTSPENVFKITYNETKKVWSNAVGVNIVNMDMYYWCMSNKDNICMKNNN